MYNLNMYTAKETMTVNDTADEPLLAANDGGNAAEHTVNIGEDNGGNAADHIVNIGEDNGGNPADHTVNIGEDNGGNAAEHIVNIGEGNGGNATDDPVLAANYGDDVGAVLDAQQK